MFCGMFLRTAATKRMVEAQDYTMPAYTSPPAAVMLWCTSYISSTGHVLLVWGKMHAP